MMNKYGFTLIEIISVIAILLIFSLIALPTINNRLNKNDEKKREIIEQSIIDAATTYCDFNDCSSLVYVTTLISENLLDIDELNNIYSNINECYVETTDNNYKLKDCVPK